jgi:DNA-binding GntR family transcriptional regulator
MKRKTVFKRAYNDGLSRLEGLAIGCDLGSEPSWAAALAVSRTIARSVFVNFATAGLIEYNGRRKVLQRRPAPREYFPEIETEPVATIVERRFLRWILQGDCRPGQMINALELSRQFGASNAAVRDYLNRLRQYGLVERLRGGGWILNGFTRDFAEEPCDVRAMFDLRSALKFVELADDDPTWTELARIEREHRVLMAEAETRFSDFSALDERFHRSLRQQCLEQPFYGQLL